MPKHMAAGNLKSGSQISVVQQSPQTIVIQPANPQVVYVPVYNPAVVYGYPYVNSGIQSVPPWRRPRACVRSWHRCGRDDEQRMLRMGI